MSLLQHEEFAIYQLRSAYLSRIRDGVGERLINLNTAFLNDPGFKAAGWTTNPSELKRTYSPPIPKTAISDYFQAPSGRDVADNFLEDDEESGGMVTGRDVNDTVGPALLAKRRKRKEDLDEDDSSELSDESDEELENTHRPANQIRFAKMPARGRAGSSPLNSPGHETGHDGGVLSPSRPPQFPRSRSGSLGAVEAIKARARRDTVTSSEQSSETELDPSVFKRQQINSNTTRKQVTVVADRIREEQSLPTTPNIESETGDEVQGSGSESSSLASGFSDTVDETSMLANMTGPLATSSLSNIKPGRPSSTRVFSEKKDEDTGIAPVNNLQALPPPRPISTIQPTSLLTMAINAKKSKSSNPFERYAGLAGSEDPNPLYIKLYIPHCEDLEGPVEMKLKRLASDGTKVTVAQAIGFCLCKYVEEELEPFISRERMNVNWWTMRMVEDEEVDDDFNVDRTKPITDFTMNNSKPVRTGRRQGKYWDELALVEATEAQYRENELATPHFSQEAAATIASEEDEQDLATPVQTKYQTPMRIDHQVRQNPITDSVFLNNAVRKDSKQTLLDAPAQSIHATPRTGAAKTLRIHYTDTDLTPRLTTVDVTTDTYIDEVFNQVCKKLNLYKALFVLKVTGTNTVAPPDRTVEAIGANRNSLDLARRRFIGDGAFGLSGSPGSTSPNAPLMLTTNTGTPRKHRKGGMHVAHPLAQQSSFAPATTALGILGANYRRYNVLRKQPMSFGPSHHRVLVLDGEYVHILPSDSGKERTNDTSHGKVTSILFSHVVGCKVNRKHPKTFRLVVFKEKETKRYDFEASSATEAADIVQELKNGMEPFRDLK